MARPVPAPKPKPISVKVKPIADPAQHKGLSNKVYVDGYGSKGTYLVIVRHNAQPNQFISVRHIQGHIRLHVHPTQEWVHLELAERGLVSQLHHRPRHGYSSAWMSPSAFAKQYEKWMGMRGVQIMPWGELCAELGLEIDDTITVSQTGPAVLPPPDADPSVGTDIELLKLMSGPGADHPETQNDGGPNAPDPSDGDPPEAA